MTVAQLLRILAVRWRMIVLMSASGLLIATIWSMVATRSYLAVAQVLVNVRAPETLGNQSVNDQLSTDYLATQIDIIRNESLAQKVVSNLGMTTSPGAAEAFGWKGQGRSLEDFLAARIRTSLTVTSNAGTSRVISIGYTSSDPKFAADMANGFADAYQQTTLELQAQPARASASWYERRAKELQQQLVTAQTKLTAKQRALGVVTDAGQADAEQARFDALSTQLASAQAQSALASSRASRGSLPDALTNPVIQNLQTEIAKLEGQRRQLATVAGPNNLDYKQLVSQINALQSQLSMQRQIIERGTSAASDQAGDSVARLTDAVEEQRVALLESRARRDEVSVLQQDVRNLQTVYDQMAARRSQLDLLGESSQSNVAILSKAVPPESPTWPRPTLMAIVGLTFGALGGIGLAMLREFFDQRMLSGDDFEAWLRIPNLATLRLSTTTPALEMRTLPRLLPGRNRHDR
jgi:succinoglycan biosynthesis transport protein ExoP